MEVRVTGALAREQEFMNKCHDAEGKFCTGEAVSFDDIGATWRDNARTAEAKARFAALPDSSMVTVFHGTTAERAESIRKSGRVQTPADYVSDLPTMARDSLYVAPTRADAANYGPEVIVFDVRKGDMQLSPEAIRYHAPDLATAFFNSFDGAVLPAGYKIRPKLIGETPWRG